MIFEIIFMSSLFQICNSLSFMLSWFENSPGKKKICCASNVVVLPANDKILFPVNNSSGFFV